MSQNSERAFSFTWRIENFSLCPYLKHVGLRSPIFAVSMLENRKLQLEFFPRGIDKSDYLSCGAMIKDDELLTLTIGYSFSIVGSEDFSYTTVKLQCILDGEGTWVEDKLALREEIMKRKDIFLPNDTLTIHYRMWIIDDYSTSTELLDLHREKENVFVGEMLNSGTMHELKEFISNFTPDKCTAVTRIAVKRKSLVWPIKGIQALSPNHRLSVIVASAMADDPAFVLSFFLTGKSAEDRKPNIEIRMHGLGYKPSCVKCKISVLDSMKIARLSSEGEHFFLENMTGEVWGFPFPFQVSEFREFLDSSRDVLCLLCEFSFSGKEDIFTAETEDAVDLQPLNYLNYNDPNTIAGEFKALYKIGILSDVTFRIGSRLFKAHKTILSTRSSVFREMFQDDTEDNESEYMDITDVDPDAFERLLLFIYSDQVDILKAEDSMKLYTAAVIYQLGPLEQRCSFFLKSILSVSNVCSILNFADSQADKHLREAAEKFFCSNANRILVSQKWKALMKENVELCCSVMYRMLTKNAN